MKYYSTALVCLLVLVIYGCQPANLNNSISGIVRDHDGPIPGAVVRVKATNISAITDAKGQFILKGIESDSPILLTAWASGYFIGGGEAKYIPGTSNIELVLTKHAEEDNPDYEWVSALASAGKEGNCENCHASTEESALPFSEWQKDAHALSSKNPRFLSMYLGQDLNGNQSPQREYGFARDYGRVPLRPDLTQPYFGPGYKLDFPATEGNCAACHVPAAAINAAYETNPSQVSEVGSEGVACDFCHKVWDVRLEQATGLPKINMPGVLSFEFRRPAQGNQFFAGPFDDVAPGHDTYTPIQRESQFCAPCHFGQFWDTQIYNSFGEWLASPYSNPETGKTCQDCHMPAGKSDHFARFDKGAMQRDPASIFSHLMPGASDQQLLQAAVSMNVSNTREGDKLIVTVTIDNDKTGHDVPTDSPLRQMILLVNVTNIQGKSLILLDGSAIPDWGGRGDPAKGYYAGLPGKGYAKILSELWTEITPSGAYWNPTRIVSDNRLAAFTADTTRYVFRAPADGKATLKVTLLFRRAFKELMDQKGWSVPDILMQQVIDHIS